MRILHITPAFYPATYFGGPTFSVYYLCNALNRVPGVEVKALTTNSAGPRLADKLEVPDTRVAMPGGYDVYYCRTVLITQFSPEMLARMVSLISWSDLVHLTAVFSPPTIPTLLACRAMRKPVLWSPRGSLQYAARSRRTRLKKAWEHVSSLVLDHRRVRLHLTSEKELLDSDSHLPCLQRAVIPNGVDVIAHDASRAWMPDGKLRLLFIGRLHPIKGIEALLKAIALLDFSVHLTICGTGPKEYSDSLKCLCASLNIGDRVRFQGEVLAAEKALAFRDADLCVIPSFAENFGMSVAESLASGVPVVVSKSTPWHKVEEVGCGSWVENSPESLAAAITQMRRRSLPELGERGRQWMAREFSWERVAAAMIREYQTLIQGDSLGKYEGRAGYEICP